MSTPATLVLDNEAVQALLDAAHPKHRRVLSLVEEVNRRNQRRRQTLVVVPVAVRVEAGWDRTGRAGVEANRISQARDAVLDGAGADRAAHLRRAAAVSVVDATVGQVAEACASPAWLVPASECCASERATPRSRQSGTVG